jgi:L-2-hydroxyglutarate oxidase LhgO
MNGKTAMFLMLSVLVGGCTMLSPGPEPLATEAPPPVAPPPKATYLKDMVQGNDETPGPTAVDSAMVWARKYTEATEKLMRLEKERRALADSHAAAANELARTKAQLAQAKKEINDANAEIIRTREELMKWKDDVLGFRGEIWRTLEAITRSQTTIIRLLGSEVTDSAGVPTTRPAGKAVASGSGGGK